MSDKMSLKTLIYNASGCWSRTEAQLDSLVECKMMTITTKTCTLEARESNKYPTYINFKSSEISLNCKGMPNFGIEYYINLHKKYKSKGIEYIISMDASDLNELSIMLEKYEKYLHNFSREMSSEIVELVEINISCPNKSDEKCRIISYDIEALTAMLDMIKFMNLKHIKIGIKLSPCTDRWLITQISLILISFKDIITFIVCGNSIPNAMVLNKDGKPFLSTEVGGMSGIPAKFINLSNVYNFNRMLCGTNIVIIGCGGIQSLADVKDYMNCGAKFCQVGRGILEQGIEILTHLNKELEDDVAEIQSKMAETRSKL